MASYVRYDTENSGPYGVNNKTRIQFKVPGGLDVFDMSNSYIDLLTSFTAVDTDDANTIPVFRLNQTGDTNTLPLNSQFIQDVRLRSRNLGLLEEIRDVGFLANNLKAYTLSRDDMESIRYRNISQIENDTNTILSGLSEYMTGVYYGSTLKSNPVRLYLGDDLLLGLGKETQMDTRYTGDVEIELNTVNVSDFVEPVEVDPLAPFSLTFENLTTEEDFENKTFTVSAITLVGEGGRGSQGLEVSADNNPFYVNMKVALQYTTQDGGGAARTVITTVEETYIQNDQTTGVNTVKVRVRALDFNDTDFATTGVLADVNMIHAPFTSVGVGGVAPTFTIEGAQLILKKYTMPPPMVEGMEFLTYQTEGRGLPEVFDVLEQFNLPKGCVNVVSIMVSGPSGRSDAVVGESSYQYSLNSLRTTPVPVIVGNGVHKDKITNTFINMGMPLKNLSLSKWAKNDSPDRQLGYVSSIMPEYFGERPDASSVMELRFNKNSTTGSRYSSVIMYKQVVRRV